jgi:predicted nucleotidyltransferase
VGETNRSKVEVVTTGNTATDQIIEEIVQAVVDAAEPERIILFGASVRGDRGPDSDVDLLVVEKQSAFPQGSRWAESSRIRKALWRFLIPIDVLIFTPEEVDKWKDSTNHVIARSCREGRVVYDRPLRS